MIILFAVLLFGFSSQSFAQLTFNYNFTTNTTVTDNGQITDTQTLGGLSTFTNVAVRLNLTSPDGNDPMWLGDMYSTLTLGAGTRTAVLLNRPGRDNNDPFGSSLSSLNVTLDDSAARTNIWATTSSTGTYNSDGRAGVNPYGAGVAFSDGDRNATLTGLNGSNIDQFTLLMADTVQGGTAQLSSWGASITGAAASTGTAGAAANGTLSIDDGGNSGAVNNLGAALTTTQNGSGGTLVVTLAGTTTFSGAVSGSGALQKAGNGTLILSNSTGNTYTGNTTVNAGTLLVNNATGSGTGTGSVTVNNSGTVLGGTGAISGAVTVNNGAILRGGDGTAASGSLSIAGAVSLASTSTIQLALGTSGTHSSLVGTGGAWSFASTQAFNFIDFGAQIGTYSGIITGLLTDPGSEGNWTITNDGWAGTFTYNMGSIDLTLTAVPEPGTWAAGILTLLAVAYTQLRRRKSHNHIISSHPLTIRNR